MAACDQIKVSTFYFQRLTSAKKKRSKKFQFRKIYSELKEKGECINKYNYRNTTENTTV